MKARKAFFYLLLILSITGLFIFPYGIINTMVSLKYETENITDCISVVSGENLCITIRNLKISFIICLIVLIFLLYFRKRILEQNRKSIN
jgi:ABC-type Mn2+/Zn2+ transport system permease subunit